MKRWFTGKMALILAAVLLMTVWVPALAAEGGSQKLTTYYSLAVGYIGKEDYGKAMEYLEAALAICQEETDPDMCADLHLKKGCVHTIRKEYDDALKELDEALRISPELAEAYLVRVQIYTETENRDEAITNLEQYIALSGDVSLNETLAELYLAREDRQKAAESYRKIAETTSDDPAEVTYNLAMYEMNAEMYAEALENLNQLTADPVKAPGLYYNSGVCNMLLGNYETAAENFTASLENETYQLDAAYNRAICRMALQNYLEAIDDFTTYIDGMLAAAAQPRPETAEPAAEESAEAPAAETAEQPEGEAAAEAAEPAALADSGPGDPDDRRRCCRPPCGGAARRRAAAGRGDPKQGVRL